MYQTDDLIKHVTKISDGINLFYGQVETSKTWPARS